MSSEARVHFSTEWIASNTKLVPMFPVKLVKAKSQALRQRLTGHHPQLTFGSRGQVATFPIMPIH